MKYYQVDLDNFLIDKNSFVFESVEKGIIKGRYTIFGKNPDKIWEFNNNSCYKYDDKKNKIKIIIKFEFIESTKSKKIDQNDPDLILELLAIDIFKKNFKYEIVLLFSNNKIINLNAEVIEITLEDQIKIND